MSNQHAQLTFDELPPASGFLSHVRRVASSALVLAGLAGVAYWGHRTDWKFTDAPPAALKQAASPGLAKVRVGGPSPNRAVESPALPREVVIEFDSTAAVEDAGIAIKPAWPGPITEAVDAPGEVHFDPARVARLDPRAAGQVWRVLRKAGDSVTEGELLALVDSADVGKAKAEFQQALVQLRLREDTLARYRVAAFIPEQTLREAEAARAAAETRLLAASQALANLGVPADPDEYRKLPPEPVSERMRLLGIPSDVPGLDLKDATANLLPIRAPFAGVVLSTEVVAGEVAQPGRQMFVITDPRRVWVTLRVRANVSHRVAPEQVLRFRPDGSAEEFAGLVEWVAPSADDDTQTVAVRTSLSNGAGKLRAGTLGQGRVIFRQESKAILVPHAAVQDFRGTPVVFVRHPDFFKPGGPKSFSARPVRVGAKDNDSTEILAGLGGGEVVATKGSGLLLNELTRGVDSTAVAEHAKGK